jgi:biuret amidohydrolase
MVDTVQAEPYDWPYDGVIVPSRTAMLVIDMQHDFCGQGGYVDRMGYDIALTAGAIAPVKAVLDTVRRIPGFTVIYTREGHRPDLTEWSRCREESSARSRHRSTSLQPCSGWSHRDALMADVSWCARRRE